MTHTPTGCATAFSLPADPQWFDSLKQIRELGLKPKPGSLWSGEMLAMENSEGDSSKALRHVTDGNFKFDVNYSKVC